MLRALLAGASEERMWQCQRLPCASQASSVFSCCNKCALAADCHGPAAGQADKTMPGAVLWLGAVVW